MIFAMLDKFLTVVGTLAIIKFFIHLFFFLRDKDSYIDFVVSYQAGVKKYQMNDKYPLGGFIDIFELYNTHDQSDTNNLFGNVFYIGCLGNDIQDIKILKYDKDKYTPIKKAEVNTIYSGEYLYVYAPLYEGAPDYALSCRVKGQKVYIEFTYNGKNGVIDKKHLKIQKDLYGFLYQYFKN